MPDCRGCDAVQNPVPRLIALREDDTAELFRPDTDFRVDLLHDVTSSAGLCAVESTSSFYWIDDVTGALTAENYTSRVSVGKRTPKLAYNTLSARKKRVHSIIASNFLLIIIPYYAKNGSTYTYVHF